MTDEPGVDDAQEDKATPEGEAVKEPASEEPADGNAAEDDPETDGDEGKAEGTEPDKPDPERTIARLSRNNKELLREKRQEAALNAQLYADLQRAQRERDEAIAGKQGKTDAPAGRPREEDFDTTEAWVDALTDWSVTRKLAEAEAKAQEQRTQAEQQQPADRLVQVLREKAPDVLEDIQALPALSLVTIAAINDADDPVAMARYLGSNPDEAERLSGMSATRVGREIAKIESGFNSRPKPNRTTNAPPVEAKPKGGGTGVVKSLHDPNLSYSEYKAIRMREIRENTR